MRIVTPAVRILRHVLLPGCLSATLAACATYVPKPLDRDAAAAASLSGLRHDGPLPDKLGLADVERLTLDNNPDLIAARTQHGLAGAQMRQAGILPNPVLTMSYADIVGGTDLVPALAAGISQDIKALVTFASRRRAADKSAQSVDASILWQEWQTVGKARLVVVDLVGGEHQLALLSASASLWRERVEKNRAALDRGDTTLDVLAPDLAAAADAQKQLDDLVVLQQTRRRELDALLGLAPSVAVPLDESIALPDVDAAVVRARLGDIADRRPDLIALQLGYAAQEEKVRAAILAQFPLFSLGVDYARDTGDVRTLGPAVTMDLPLFDRNQGAIAQEDATRAQLHAEFEARLIAAKSEVAGLLGEQATLRGQLARKRELLAALGPAADSAQQAFDAGDIDERTYVDLLATRNAKRQEILALEQSLLEQQVALATLVGAGMPAVALPVTDETSEAAR